MGPIQVVVQDGNNLVLEVTPTPNTTVILDRGIAGPPGPTGTGDVDGPASATDNAVARFDGTTGKLIQNSVVTIGDTGNIAGVGTLAVTDLTDSSLTSGRVTYAGIGGNLVDSANLTFNGTDLTVAGAVNAGSINATTLDLTNLEVTNIKAKDGTSSITLADSTGIATFAANPIINAGTANGVAYLNGSKVLTTGSALVFDGSRLGVGASPVTPLYVKATAGGTDPTVVTGERVRIQSNDTVGRSTYLSLIAGTSAFSGVFFGDQDAADVGLIRYLHTDNSMTFNTSGSEQMRLTSSLLSVVPGATIQGLTVGRGAGAVASNTAVGASALAANTSGVFNTAVGFEALSSNTDNSANTAVGYRALRTQGAGTFQNTAMGAEALTANTTGVNNTGIGRSALLANTTGTNNAALGFQALASNLSASSNTAVGYQSLYSYINGAGGTVAVGYQAGYTTNAAYGTFVGQTAGYSSTGANNTHVGFQAGYFTTTGTNNTSLGWAALQGSVSGSSGGNNTAIGSQSLLSNTTGSYNTAIGFSAIKDGVVTGRDNVAIGVSPLNLLTSGVQNISLGTYSLYENTTGSNNIAIGSGNAVGGLRGALAFNTTGNSNIGIGYQALHSNTTADHNIAIGYQAGYSNTIGGSNSFVGYQAGYLNTTGSVNTAMGNQALNANVNGNYNAAFGDRALRLATGSSNAAFGGLTLYSNTSGQFNTAVGGDALYNNTTASNNTAVGYQAGYNNTTGTFNTYIGGRGAGYNATGSQNTFVGDYAGREVTTGGFNTLIGQGAGYLITTGTRNTVLGLYSGNQGGLDIRTANNHIVLSDGDGTPQFVINGSNQSGLFGLPFSGWDSTRYRSLQFGNGTSARYFSVTQQFTAACAGSLLWNAYGDGDNAFKYSITGDRAAMIQIASDAVNIYGAPTGTAGNAISWSTLLGVQRNFSVALQGASGQSGTGITFPATQNASSNANTLDDYEEGTWTPTDGSGAGRSFSNINSTYTKIGRQVTVVGFFITDVSASAAAFQVNGLPFASVASTQSIGTFGSSSGTAAISVIPASASYVNASPPATYNTAITNSQISFCGVAFTVTYFI